MHSVKNNSCCTRAGGGGSEKQGCTRTPRSCIQHLTISPACSFRNDCHLPPCSALHGCWKPLLSHFSTLSNIPTALPSHLPRNIINRSFLHFCASLILPSKQNKPSAASSLSEALKHQACESEVLWENYTTETKKINTRL